MLTRVLTLVLALGAALPTAAETALEARSRALTRASAATLGLSATAVEDARSASSLGRQREGSGVLISADGLVLTIGYLILEAESVALTTDDGRRFPARVVAYDLATGFGLVQALAPLGLDPVPLGDPAGARDDDALVMASGGDNGAVTAARLVSRRAFSGYWEYHVEGALFTAPARRDHSGAALFNPQGELLGIGSLFVHDAQAGPGPRQPGNMFVPVDLLKPVLAELRQRGSSRASARAWLGLNCIVQDGEVRVMRVSDDSPADVAGLQPGDHIVRIDGTAVADLALLWKTLWAGPRAERAVTLEIVRDGQTQTLTVQAVDRAKTLKRAPGI